MLSPGLYNGEFIYTEPRLSIRAYTCGDGGGRSGKTDIISLFFNEGGFSQVAELVDAIH